MSFLWFFIGLACGVVVTALVVVAIVFGIGLGAKGDK